jgi:hypothetical protein
MDFFCCTCCCVCQQAALQAASAAETAAKSETAALSLRVTQALSDVDVHAKARTAAEDKYQQQLQVGVARGWVLLSVVVVIVCVCGGGGSKRWRPEATKVMCLLATLI